MMFNIVFFVYLYVFGLSVHCGIKKNSIGYCCNLELDGHGSKHCGITLFSRASTF